MVEKISYRCYTCYSMFYIGEEKVCPKCGEKHIEKMCKDDPGECTCAHEVHESIKICDTCNKPMCPECGSHSVVAISRVTGFCV
jgi:rRNA maturation protein Nop10